MTATVPTDPVAAAAGRMLAALADAMDAQHGRALSHERDVRSLAELFGGELGVAPDDGDRAVATALVDAARRETCDAHPQRSPS